ncbi:hypothetical protein [Haloterrigena alkaliphila]|uniref:RCK C-terminal domain-containing protein n=1 Tax=Haloterrigena alkaliphila TaxID=2816475 RepID=A0A8A2VKC5_9EURY|nr:hypothetical protein [Haloterrigena alkaliphila]QSX00936.1 hypothetical protein J0X25_08240 [Haloterrigena alkaliphila]
MNPLSLTPIELLTGVSFGLSFGVVTAVLVGCVSFAASALVGARLPSIAGGVVTVAVTAGTLSAADVLDASSVQPGLLLALGVGFVLGLYATSWGVQFADALPRLAVGTVERTRPLSADAIDAVDAIGQITIRSSGGVREFEGYPPLDPELRAALEDGAWRLPADLPLSELEARLEDRLRTTDDFEAVSVAVDGRGRATITAAPPANGVAGQVPEGWRAVSVRALLPTGLCTGDDVLAVTGSTTVAGTVLSTNDAPVADGGRIDAGVAGADAAADGTDTFGPDFGPTAPSRGGEGQVTVAVPTTDAETLLEARRVRIAVTPGETTHEFDAVSVLERDGTAIRKATLTEPILAAIDNDVTDLEIFALRGADAPDSTVEGEWQFDPDAEAVAVGAEAFLLGTDGDAVETGSGAGDASVESDAGDDHTVPDAGDDRVEVSH